MRCIQNVELSHTSPNGVFLITGSPCVRVVDPRTQKTFLQSPAWGNFRVQVVSMWTGRADDMQITDSVGPLRRGTPESFDMNYYLVATVP